MLLEFTIDGIDDNLKEDASKSYLSNVSFADADWYPSFWGENKYGSTAITGDGSYTVYIYLKGNCEGAVVWVIEISDLWKDLVDPAKVNVTINKAITPGKY